MGVRLLLTVPNEASAPVFLKKLGWSALPSLRVWARVKVLPARLRAARVERFEHTLELQRRRATACCATTPG